MGNEKKYEWLEHLGKAFESLCADIKKILPEEAYDHFRASRKEMLLAIRALLDRQIERLEKKEERVAKKVEVK